MSKELYDLCRRYKHFYKKHQDVMEWSKKYHDLDLGNAIDTATFQLWNATHNLQKGLFREFDVHCTSIDIENEVPIYSRFPKIHHSTSEVEFQNSREFLHCLMMYMSDMRGFYEMR